MIGLDPGRSAGAGTLLARLEKSADAWKLAVALLTMPPPVVAAGLASASLSPAPGTAVVTIVGEGSELRVDLAAPAASLMGFGHAASSPEEREILRLTRENLRTGDGLVRFSTRADCRLTDVAVSLGRSAAGVDAKGRQDLTARYQFACAQPGLLDSAAFALFGAFPALERVFVRYQLSGVRGDAELDRTRPVVSFVPLY